MATIYLSSTFEDLKDYRRVVFEALRQSGHNVIAMEEYVAKDQRPLKQYRKNMDRINMEEGGSALDKPLHFLRNMGTKWLLNRQVTSMFF